MNTQELGGNPQITKILDAAKIANIQNMPEVLTEQDKKVAFDGKVLLISSENNIKAGI